MKRILSLALALTLALSLFVCGGSTATASAGTIDPSLEVYKIGCIFPMTGTIASSGEYCKNAVELAAEKINNSGGINGHKVEVIVEDSKGVPRDGIMAYKKLVDVNKVIAIVPTISSVVMALVPEVNAADVVMINTLAKTNDIVGAGPRIFSITIPTSGDGTYQGTFAYEVLGARTAAMLYVKSDVGISYDKFVTEEFERLGGKILSRDGHDGGTTDFRAVLTKIKQENPDIIFVESQYQEIASIIKQARDLGIDTQTMSFSSVLSGQFNEITGKAGNGHLITVSGYDPEENLASVQDFVKSYRDKYGAEPIIDSAMTYDAVMMFAEAIRSNGYTADGISQGLMDMPGYEGATGVIEKFNDRHVVSRPIRMQVHQDGKWLYYDEQN
ncbi:MAG: ABC transporter substrate-binding protein [Clostridiales bacterium]|nr:ABC transporter substrate-binding protein [Clostridiales bacterium]